MSRERKQIAPGEVDLWFISPPQITDPDKLRAYYSLMDAGERARHERFIFAQHRHQFLVTRAFVRSVLSTYVAVDPAAWQFITSSHGKPAIHPKHEVDQLFFNLSHTDGLAVCAVACSQVGVDVENIYRRSQTIEIANRYFAPQEVAELRTWPATAQRKRFFTYWTLKEAYVKAQGHGLSIELHSFAFCLANEPEIHIEFLDHQHPAEQAKQWSFAVQTKGDEHIFAVALHQSEGGNLRLHEHSLIP